MRAVSDYIVFGVALLFLFMVGVWVAWMVTA